MKLNLGSNNKKYLDYINIDLDENKNPDYVLNLETDKFPFDDNTVDEVLAHHILEHLGDGFFHCIQEIYRVCKHDAIIDIKVPHPRHDTFYMDPTHKRAILPYTFTMFSKSKNKKDLIENTAEPALGLIYDVDFEIIDMAFTLDPFWDLKIPHMPEKEGNFIMRSFNNVISEINIKLSVIKNTETE